MAPANEAERELAGVMLRGVAPSETSLVLGDANYSGAALSQAAREHGHAMAASPKRSKPLEGESDRRWRRWLRGHRVLIETVLSMLADQFRVETTRARSLLGVQVRVLTKVLAYDLSIVLNRLLGRPPLAIKSLYL